MIIRTTMWNSNTCLPKSKKQKFYEPSDNGHERNKRMDGVFKEEFIEKLGIFIEKTYNRSRICTVVRNVAPECMLLSGGKIK